MFQFMHSVGGCNSLVPSFVVIYFNSCTPRGVQHYKDLLEGLGISIHALRAEYNCASLSVLLCLSLTHTYLFLEPHVYIIYLYATGYTLCVNRNFIIFHRMRKFVLCIGTGYLNQITIIFCGSHCICI